MNEELKPGDWVRLVNLDDDNLTEGTVYELGKLYQIIDFLLANHGAPLTEFTWFVFQIVSYISMYAVLRKSTRS